MAAVIVNAFITIQVCVSSVAIVPVVWRDVVISSQSPVNDEIRSTPHGGSS